MTTEATKPARELEPITYSALSTFRNCRKKYWWRYEQELTPKYRDPVLEFGMLWHKLTELLDLGGTLESVTAYLADALPLRESNEQQRKFWHLAGAMLRAYVRRYQDDDATVIAAEKKFSYPIYNPATGSPSRTFVMQGKVDAILERGGRRYIRERKTASSVDESYIEKLWTDFQSQLYAYFIEAGITEMIFVTGRTKRAIEDHFDKAYELESELAAKNKSGKSSAVQQIAEPDHEFAARLDEKYQGDGLFLREPILFSRDELEQVRAEVWELTQAILDARRRNAWYKNTSQCFAYGKPCAYYALCRSGGNPLLIENQYEKRAPHEELKEDSSSVDAPLF